MQCSRDLYTSAHQQQVVTQSLLASGRLAKQQETIYTHHMHRCKEQELQQVQRGRSAAAQQEGSHSAEAQHAKQQVKALEGQLRDLHSRLTSLQADTRCCTPGCT